MLLNDVKIRNAKPRAKPYKMSDGDGMFLYVHPNGSKYWRFKYRFAGKEKLLALGVYPEVGLADARERRAQARKTLAAGNDPNEIKKEAKRLALIKSETTFEAVAREWHQTNLHRWSTKHGADVIKRLEVDIFHKLGTRPIANIGAPELLSTLRICH
jgi:hypothetical protein